ncbi:LPS export ABC transporter periplasmic protein LptC [Allohahella marinimesophila]
MTLQEMAGNAVRSKRLVLAVVLIVLTAAFWYQAFNDEDVEVVRLADDAEPDAFILQASYRTYNLAGMLESRLESVRAEQFVDTDIGVLSLPRLDIHEEAGERNFWHMSADKGTYDARYSVLTLDQNVEILGSTLENQPIRVLTSGLVYTMGDEHVETNNAVEVISGSDRIQGTGMELDMQQRAVELKQDVRAIYQARPAYE